MNPLNSQPQNSLKSPQATVFGTSWFKHFAGYASVYLILICAPSSSIASGGHGRGTKPSNGIVIELETLNGKRHIFQYESGSSAGLSGIQLNLIDGVNGIFTPEQVEPLILPESAYYMPRTRVVEIENTHSNAV